MSATETRPTTAGHLDRRDVLRGAAAVVAGGVAFASQDAILAQGDEQARAVDEQFFPGFKTEKVRTSGAVIHAVVGGTGPPWPVCVAWKTP